MARATKVVRTRVKKGNGNKVLVKKTTKKVTKKPHKMGKCPTCNRDY